MKDLKIDIQDLVPTYSSFKLKQFGDDEIKLQPCTGGKLIEMNRIFGDVQKMLGNPTAENVSKIAMALMEYESAVKFKKQKVKLIDVLTGDEKEVEIGGYEILMNCIRGIDEQYSIYAAILISLGYSKDGAGDVVKQLKDGINKLVNSELNKENETVKKKKTKK